MLKISGVLGAQHFWKTVFISFSAWKNQHSLHAILISSVLLRQSSRKKEFCEFMAAFCYSLLICKSEEFNTVLNSFHNSFHSISGKILHSPLSLRSLRMKLQVKFPLVSHLKVLHSWRTVTAKIQPFLTVWLRLVLEHRSNIICTAYSLIELPGIEECDLSVHLSYYLIHWNFLNSPLP